ncbi:MAG: AGE family epimerase/isomerase [Armatimonadetes bacterium]|nr:AGE family epimerase/isomerase [Armatimonadota bacterium]
MNTLAKTYRPRLEKNLKENIIAFWYPKSLDKTNGGYYTSFGPQGELKEGGTKMIVTQARMVWLFARLARAGYGEQYLDAAGHGYRFLMDKMWDEKHGGFYWEVDATGDTVLMPKKHLYGQSFALYALSEYALASKKPEALESATRLFRLLEEKAHDKRYGGYIEAFNADWTAPPPGEKSYMGVPSDVKLMNTHLHLMEAMTTFVRASDLPLARERLRELITIESNTVVRKEIGACTDKYARDWTPLLEGSYATVSYGHDLENIWLLIGASDAAGVPNALLTDLYRTLFDYSLKHGYDRSKGGFYDAGAFNKRAGDRNKTWWVQAEALVSALYMYRLTGEAKYREVFERTLDFIDRYQTDWKHGEWHATVMPDGKGTGDKAHIWKAGYHNGRAMIECLVLLNESTREQQQ